MNIYGGQLGCLCLELELLEVVHQVGQDPPDGPDLVRQLGQAVSEQKFPLEFVAASAHQLLQLQDVGGGAEGGGDHEGEQQLLRPADQLGQQGMDFLLG